MNQKKIQIDEKQSINLDEKDIRILDNLQEDCQTPKSQIAKNLNMPKTTIYNRINRLEESGIIERYQAILDPSKLGQDLQMIIQVRAKYGKNYKQEVGKLLSEIPGVWAVFFVFGDQDFIVLARAENRKKMVEKIEQLMQHDMIERSSSIIVGETIKLEHKVQLNNL